MHINKYNSRILTFIIILSTMFSYLPSKMLGFDIGDIFLLSFFLIFMIKYINFQIFNYIKKQEKNILFFYIFTVLITFAFLPLQKYVTLIEVIGRIIRWGLYIFIFIFANIFFDFEYAKFLFIILGIFNSLTLIFQVIIEKTKNSFLTFNIFGTVVGYSFEDRGHMTPRPSAIFMEPSHFSYFIITCIIVVLFDDHIKLSEIRKIILFSVFFISIILSTSTTGILIASIIFIFYLCKQYIYTNKNFLKTLFTLIILIFIFLFAYAFFKYSKENEIVKYTILKLAGLKTNRRFNNIFKVIEELPVINRIIGVGAGNEDGYFLYYIGHNIGFINSITLTILYAGISGLLVFAFTQFKIFKIQNNIISRFLLISFLSLSVITNLFYTKYMILFYIYICVCDFENKSNAKAMVTEPLK